jgi:hypothetical protein
MAAERDQPGATYRSGQQEGTQTFHGKIMSLHDYLAQGSGAPSGAASSIDRQGASTPPTSDPQNQQPRTTTQTIDQNAPPRTAVNEPPQEGELRSQPGSDRFGPTDRTTADRVGAQAQSDAARLQTAQSSSAWAVQPLVLVVSRSSEHGQSSQFRSSTPATTDPNRRDPTLQTTQTAQQQQPSGQQQSQFAGTAGMGEAYLLVFDPQNYASRLALSQAHGMIPESGLTVGSSATPSDRLPVRAEDASSDQRTGVDQRRWDARSGMTSGAQVKVTGKVLSRGGLKAIEVASIEKDSSMESTRESTPGANRQYDQDQDRTPSTTPNPTTPNPTTPNPTTPNPNRDRNPEN